MLDKIKAFGTQYKVPLYAAHFLLAIVAMLVLFSGNSIVLAGVAQLVGGVAGATARYPDKGAEKALGALLGGAALLAIPLLGLIAGLLLLGLGIGFETGLLKTQGE